MYLFVSKYEHTFKRFLLIYCMSYHFINKYLPCYPVIDRETVFEKVQHGSILQIAYQLLLVGYDTYIKQGFKIDNIFL